MAKTYTITVDDHIHKALETEFLDPEAHFDNFVDHRYKLLSNYYMYFCKVS